MTCINPRKNVKVLQSEKVISNYLVKLSRDKKTSKGLFA